MQNKLMQIAQQVANKSVVITSTGQDECPYCNARGPIKYAMSSLPHREDCAYILARNVLGY